MYLQQSGAILEQSRLTHHNDLTRAKRRSFICKRFQNQNLLDRARERLLNTTSTDLPTGCGRNMHFPRRLSIYGIYNWPLLFH